MAFSRHSTGDTLKRCLKEKRKIMSKYVKFLLQAIALLSITLGVFSAQAMAKTMVILLLYPEMEKQRRL